MNRGRFSHCNSQWRLLCASALVGAGLMMTGNATLAQPMETIVVTAPRVVHQTIVTGRSPTGATIEETTISRNVTFDDLDLSKAHDADALRTRVRDTARDLCAELDKLFPFEPKDTNCVKKSADRAMIQADQLIAEAHK